jgi:hypothetical protein
MRRKRELGEILKPALKTLVLQEVRSSQMRSSIAPPLMAEEIAHSIRETKREIVKLVEAMAREKSVAFLKGMILEAVDEQIDRIVQLRKNRCFRCIHVRYFDKNGTAHAHLPTGPEWAEMIGCEMIRTPSRARCKGFAEHPFAASADDFLMEMSFFYEVKEMFTGFEEIWNYLQV